MPGAIAVSGRRLDRSPGTGPVPVERRSRNVGVIIDDAALAARLATWFATLWQSPYAVPVDPDATYTAPRIE